MCVQLFDSSWCISHIIQPVDSGGGRGQSGLSSAVLHTVDLRCATNIKRLNSISAWQQNWGTDMNVIRTDVSMSLWHLLTMPVDFIDKFQLWWADIPENYGGPGAWPRAWSNWNQHLDTPRQANRQRTHTPSRNTHTHKHLINLSSS